MAEGRRVFSYLASGPLPAALAACGGGSDVMTGPSPTPAPTPTPPQIVASTWPW